MFLVAIITCIVLQFSVTQKFLCTNGKDPKIIGKKQTLLEFSKSPCHPVVLIPGIESTKLSIVIDDCKQFRNLNPKIFQICGFTHCKRELWEFWKKVPHKEYNMWLPELFSDMGIFTFDETQNMCWASIVQQHLDLTKPIEQNPKRPKGFRITVYGNTPKTKKNFQCGDGAVSNILNLPFNLQIGETKAFDKIIHNLRNLGHVPGLTYQSLPYNFIDSYRNCNLKNQFLANIERLYQLTGKKVVIIAHSFGNINTYYQIRQLTRQQKDTMIKTWVQIMPPYFGSLKVQNNCIGGVSELMIVKNIIGLRLKASILGVNQLIGMHELTAVDPFELHRDKEWFKPILQRIKYEKGEVSFEESGFSQLPKLEDTCTPNNFYFPGCYMGIYDTSENFSMKIQNNEYKMNETYQMYQRYNMTNTTADFYKLTRDEEHVKIINPEVPVVFVIARSIQTIKQLIFPNDPLEQLKKDQYQNVEYVWGNGDDAVPTFSSLIPALKWLKEFENDNKKFKPVKIVDYCSYFNNKNTPYDYQDEQGEFHVNNNDFFGIQCDCIQSNDQTNCHHASAVSDNFMWELLENIIKGNQKSNSKEYEDFVANLDVNYLETITTICPQVLF